MLGLLVAGFAGCGSASSSVDSDSATQSQSTHEQSNDADNVAATNRQLAFTATVEGAHGDTAEIKGYVSDAVPPSESGAPSGALSRCHGDDRALVVQLDFENTLTSSLPSRLMIANFSGSMRTDRSGTMYVILDYSDGPLCVPPGDQVTRNVSQQLEPNSTGTFRAWYVLPDAITPNNPNPTQDTLGQWALSFPTIILNDEGPIINGHIGGPRVQCPANRFEGEVLIFLAGPMPAGSEDSCGSDDQSDAATEDGATSETSEATTDGDPRSAAAIEFVQQYTKTDSGISGCALLTTDYIEHRYGSLDACHEANWIPFTYSDYAGAVADKFRVLVFATDPDGNRRRVLVNDQRDEPFIEADAKCGDKKVDCSDDPGD